MDTSSSYSRRPHSIFWPLLLIGLGLFLLFKTLGYITGETADILLRLWPLLFIVGGLDSLYRRDSYVGAVFWIGIGTIILLSNFGYIQVGSWLAFLRLWPVLFIAWGLDLLIGHRTLWSAAAGIVIGLALIAAVFLFTTTQPQVGVAAVATPVSQELQGATQATVTIKSATGSLDVTGGAGSGMLVSGQVNAPGNMNVQHNYTVASGHGNYSIDSGEVTGIVTPFFSTRDYPWTLKLANSIPLDLDASQAVGEQTLDLTGLNLSSLHTETALGQNTITLPDSGSFDGRASVALGELVIRVPRGAAVQLTLDTAIAGVTLPSDFTRDGNIATSPGAQGASNPIHLTVNVPIGSLRVEYSD